MSSTSRPRRICSRRCRRSSSAGAARILIDLDQVELLDSFGIGVLVDAHKRARSRDGRLVVLITRERLRHVIERAGLDGTLDLVADADEVLATGEPDGPAEPDDGR